MCSHANAVVEIRASDSRTYLLARLHAIVKACSRCKESELLLEREEALPTRGMSSAVRTGSAEGERGISVLADSPSGSVLAWAARAELQHSSP